MAIWIPEKMYRTLPVLCWFLGLVTMATAGRPLAFMLGLTLAAYGAAVMGRRIKGIL